MQRAGRALRLLVVEYGAPDVRIPEHRDSGEAGNNLLQQVQSLPAELRRHAAITGDVSARTCQAHDEAGPDRIGAVGHHDRDRLRLLLDRRNPFIGGRHDDVHLDAHQLGRGLGEPLTLALAEPVFEENVSSFHVSTLPHPFFEGRREVPGARRGAYLENPDPRDLRARLRGGGEWRREHADGQRDDQREHGPPHVASCRTKSIEETKGGRDTGSTFGDMSQVAERSR